MLRFLRPGSFRRWGLLPRDLDVPLLVAGLGLATIGLVAVYSAGQTAGSSSGTQLAENQALWFAVGLIALAAAALVPFRLFEAVPFFLYPLCLLLLLLVPLVGAGDMRGQRWLRLGPLTVQPSELTKIAVILALAFYLSRSRGRPESLRRLIVPFLLVGIPGILVAKQPDLGSSIVLAGVFFPMLYYAGLDPLYLVLLVTPLLGLIAAASLPAWVVFMVGMVAVIYFGRLRAAEKVIVVGINLGLGLGAPLLWGHLEDYQRERILTFIDPNRDPLGAGYQILQSKVALGSGAVLGKGYLAGTQKALAFLPARHTDFIYAVFGEEFGFIGAALVLVLFFLLAARGFALAGQVRHRFAGLVAVGISSSLVIHVAVNIGMTLGLVPVTGIPLPLLSYGGSSLVTTMASLGVLINIGMRRREF